MKKMTEISLLNVNNLLLGLALLRLSLHTRRPSFLGNP
jgi:hypothetical protein